MTVLYHFLFIADLIMSGFRTTCVELLKND